MNKEEAVRAALGQVERYIACKLEKLNRICDDDYCEGMASAFNDIDLFIQNMDIDTRVDVENDVLDILNYLEDPVHTFEANFRDELSDAFEKYLDSVGKKLTFQDEEYTIKERTRRVALDLTSREANYLYDAVNIAKEEMLQVTGLEEEDIDKIIGKVYEAIKEV